MPLDLKVLQAPLAPLVLLELTARLVPQAWQVQLAFKVLLVPQVSPVLMELLELLV